MLQKTALFYVVLTLTVASAPAFSQATGTISGTVFDVSGAVIPGAEVTAIDAGTNRSRSVTAGESGRYVIPLLPAANYSVRVEKAGFTPFVQRNVVLQVNTEVQVNAHLNVGRTTEEVTVRSEVALIQPSSTTFVQVVDERRIVDLPLNGRNVLQLVSLNAGVSDRGLPGTGAGAVLGQGAYQEQASMNGARSTTTNFLLDNADHNDGHYNTPKPYPNPDAIQEFSVQTSTFDAQYGRGTGGVINVVTKSGTNEFRGTLFNFLRNYKLNAANFFSGRDTLKRNQFGGTLGGPVLLPRLYNGKDRTFFFISYQLTKSSSSTPAALAVTPSEAMKQGDFSEWLTADGRGRISDPLSSGAFFPNNVIPRSRFDPVSTKLLAYMPASTSPSYQLRFATPKNIVNDDQIMFRADHALSDEHRFSFRYFLLDYNRPTRYLPENWYFVQGGQTGKAANTSLSYTAVLSPHWMNLFTFAYSPQSPRLTTPDELNVDLQRLGARVQNLSDVSMLSLSFSGWAGINFGNVSRTPQSTIQVSNSLSYATGRHNLRFGGDVRRYRFYFSSYNLTQGQASFTGQMLSERGRQNAGNAFAEFLLGVAGRWRQLSLSELNLRNTYYSLFLQDDIRLTHRLSLNLGLRYDPKFDFDEVDDKRTTFVPGQQSTVFPNAPRGLVFYGDRGLEKRLIQPDLNNLAPRVGLAYQLSRTTVVRSAYGIFYDEYMSTMNNRIAQGQPYVQDATIVGPVRYSDPYAGGPLLNPAPFVPDSSFQFTPYGTFAVPGRDMRAGYMQNWNLVIEHQVGDDVLLRAAYVGSKGTHLMNATEANPGVYRAGATASNLNQRRRYQPIGSLVVGSSDADSSYNSLQFTLQKRYSRGVSILANYTWSKSIDTLSHTVVAGNNSGPDPFNLRNNRGLSDFDMPHRLVVSGIWEMPRLRNSAAFIRTLVGGWQSNFILTAASGVPLTIRSGVDNDFNGVAGDFADYNGGEWRLDGGRSKQEQINAWFNTSVFSTNSTGTIGTARRGQLRGPGEWNVNYSLFKHFDLTERIRLQLRGEFFNFFNHANLGNPNSSAISPNFGSITSAGEPRIIQLAVKLVF